MVDGRCAVAYRTRAGACDAPLFDSRRPHPVALAWALCPRCSPSGPCFQSPPHDVLWGVVSSRSTTLHIVVTDVLWKLYAKVNM